jgi:hypothetical protein
MGVTQLAPPARMPCAAAPGSTKSLTMHQVMNALEHDGGLELAEHLLVSGGLSPGRVCH